MTAPTLPGIVATPWDPEHPKVNKPGVYDGMPDGIYHADPVPGRSLSASGAKKLLEPSCPALFDHERRNPPAPKAVFDFGHAAHKMVLGIGPTIISIDADDWRTKQAKTEAAEARAAGHVPLLTKDFAIVQEMAVALRAHPIASSLFNQGTGIAEASLFWQDKPTGIIRRCRLDWLPTPQPGRRMIIADYKSARSAQPDQFAKAAADYGYHLQDAWYRDGVKALGLADDPAFVFVVQEKTAPYLVSVIELDHIALEIGRYLSRAAVRIYDACTRTGNWPGYTTDVARVSLPAYYERRYAEEMA